MKCYENDNRVFNQDLRGKIDYDTEKCHAVTFILEKYHFLPRVSINKSFCMPFCMR